MHFKNIFFLLLLIIMASCKSIPEEVRRSIVTIHAIDKTGIKSKLIISLNIDGQTVNVSRIPLLSNRDITYAEPYQYMEEKYGFVFHLTEQGKYQWQQACVEYRGRLGILAVGGQFKCYIRFSHQFTGAKAQIAAPLSKKEAQEMSKDITRNYQSIKDNS